MLMKPNSLLFLSLALSGVLIGCTVTPAKPTDVRAALLASARHNEPDFPDGRNLVLTHFSHVGQLVTSSGDVIYVADQHSVTADALSPHGQSFIVFFDQQFRYLGKLGYYRSHPLWCDGSRLYLFGDLNWVFFNTDLDRKLESPSGNVVDVAEGFEHLRVYHAWAYGSSGGLEDKWSLIRTNDDGQNWSRP